MTLTFELDLGKVTLNQPPNTYVKSHLVYKFLSGHTHTHTTALLLYWTTEVVSEMKIC